MACPLVILAIRRRFEPLTSAVTGQRSDQLNYRTVIWHLIFETSMYYLDERSVMIRIPYAYLGLSRNADRARSPLAVS